MDLNLACNLLNFVFKTSNAISYEILALYEFKKFETIFFRAPMWKSGLNFKEKLTSALKTPSANVPFSYKVGEADKDAFTATDWGGSFSKPGL
jgi:hypothetical protein